MSCESIHKSCWITTSKYRKMNGIIKHTFIEVFFLNGDGFFPPKLNIFVSKISIKSCIMFLPIRYGMCLGLVLNLVP